MTIEEIFEKYGLGAKIRSKSWKEDPGFYWEIVGKSRFGDFYIETSKGRAVCVCAGWSRVDYELVEVTKREKFKTLGEAVRAHGFGVKVIGLGGESYTITATTPDGNFVLRGTHGEGLWSKDFGEVEVDI